MDSAVPAAASSTMGTAHAIYGGTGGRQLAVRLGVIGLVVGLVACVIALVVTIAGIRLGGRFRLLQCCDGGAQISGGLVNHSLVGGSDAALAACSALASAAQESAV